MSKKVAPAALNALKDSLCSVYWYKKDLRSFLINCLPNCPLLGRLNWEDNKRNVAGALVDTLARGSDHSDLLVLIEEVCRVDDFSHLRLLEDGPKKAKVAADAVTRLRRLWLVHADVTASNEKAAAARAVAQDRLRKADEVSNRLASLNRKFMAMVVSNDAQRRGYELEGVLREIFELFDLDPKASFRVEGDQVDGAFVFENADFLLEAKWRSAAADAAALDSLAGKLQRRLDNTLGLFISMSGFSEGAISAHSGMGRRMILLMDGADLAAVIEGRVELPVLLGRKRRHAAQTGEIFLPASRILI